MAVTPGASDQIVLDDLLLIVDTGVGGDPATAFYRPHDSHKIGTLLANRTDITGRPGRQNINQQILLWAYDDFSGGAGQKFYDSSKPTKYYTRPGGVGAGNARVGGYFTGTPTITATTIEAYNALTAMTFSCAADGFLWVAAYQKAWSSPDTTTWTSRATGVAQTIMGMASDGRRIYLSDVNPATGSTIIVRMDTAGNGTLEAATARAELAGANRAPLAFIANNTSPFLFLFTGTKLYTYDTTAGLGIVGTLAHTVADNVAPTGLRYIDMVATDTSVVYMTSTAGRTRIYHYAPTGTTSGAPVWAGAPLWTLPSGFTGYNLCYQNGQLYVVGRTEGRAALWSMDYNSKAIDFVGYLLPEFSQLSAWDNDDSGWEIGNGTGSQVLLDAPVPLIFDQSTSGYTGWHDSNDTNYVTNQAQGSLGSFDGARYLAGHNATNVSIMTFGSDFDSTTSGGGLETAAWDFDIPEQEKRFLGLHVVTSALGTPTVTISYQADESGSYTALPTLNSGTANFQDAPIGASTVTFRQMRLKIVVTGGAKVYSVTLRADIPDYQETWELTIRLKDEKYTQGNGRNRGWTGDQLRKALFALRSEKRIVSFLDGTADRAPGTQGANGGYTTQNVVIDDIEDVLPYNSQGSCHITLRSVAP